ncbi:MAG: hypothetical protein SGILL_004016 [Bacillariaceae sp.]
MGAKKKQQAKKPSPVAPTDAPAATDSDVTTSISSSTTRRRKQPTALGKFVVYLVFPLIAGMLGLVAVYLDSSNVEKKMRIERDFALPFSIALLLAVVIGFQTSGYTSKPQPLVRMPRVQKVQTVRQVHTVKVDGNGGEDQGDKKND